MNMDCAHAYHIATLWTSDNEEDSTYGVAFVRGEDGVFRVYATDKRAAIRIDIEEDGGMKDSVPDDYPIDRVRKLMDNWPEEGAPGVDAYTIYAANLKRAVKAVFMDYAEDMLERHLPLVSEADWPEMLIAFPDAKHTKLSVGYAQGLLLNVTPWTHLRALLKMRDESRLVKTIHVQGEGFRLAIASCFNAEYMTDSIADIQTGTLIHSCREGNREWPSRLI